ncbi:hypothetical protein BU16DRAFT_186659 [Lophium mytilinum]|uniref:Receptor L-domain domain-containing protein n=1 Tax=Lophium mytilinum TaxID=390894 RepID=A0A6A6R8D1_9PEZI|nr:hypothetical protein BU16DRAFT_186659 [Lophium mytilinum]
MASCTTFSGSIAIATETTDDIRMEELDAVLGNFVAIDVPGLKSLNLSSVWAITGALRVERNENLQNLTVPNDLGNVSFISLPALEGPPIDDDYYGLYAIDSLEIHNTSIRSLSFTSSDMVSLNISNNDAMSEITVLIPSIKSLTIAGNNVYSPPDVTLNLCKNISNVLLRNVYTCAAPDLNFVQESLIIEENPGLTHIYFESLYTVQSSIVIANNTDLSYIILPSLESAGSLSIRDNPKVMVVDLIDKLAVVRESVNISGNMGNVSFPELKDAASLSISSDNSTFDCSDFAALWTQIVVENYYDCQGDHFDRVSISGLATEEKTGIGVGVGVGTILICVGIGLISYRRRRQKRRKATTSEEEPAKVLESLVIPLAELGGVVHRKEMPTGKEAAELPDHHGMSEAEAVTEPLMSVGGTHELEADTDYTRASSPRLKSMREHN